MSRISATFANVGGACKVKVGGNKASTGSVDGIELFTKKGCGLRSRKLTSMVVVEWLVVDIAVWVRCNGRRSPVN